MSECNQNRLIVGRDRAHVRVLMEDHPTSKIITASQFFDRVRLLAFLYDEKLVRDDHAPNIIAHKVIQNQKSYSPKLSKNFAALYSAFYHGVSSPTLVQQLIANSSFAKAQVIETLGIIDETMADMSLVNGVSALYRSWQIMTTRKVLPPTLAMDHVISLQYLVDLTLLEIEVIKELSRLGKRFEINFPLDFYRRSINVAVDFSAKQFERSQDLSNIELFFHNISTEGPLAPLIKNLFEENAFFELPDQSCRINLAQDIYEEAELLAWSVAQVIRKNPRHSIAVVVRNVDERAQIFRHALERFLIRVKDRKGISFFETPAGTLVESLFKARLWSLRRRDLLGLISHPLFSLKVPDEKNRACFLRLIKELSIDDHIVPDDKLNDRYSSPIGRYREILLGKEESSSDLDRLEQLTLDILALLRGLPEQAQPQHFLRCLIELLEAGSTGEDASLIALKEAVTTIKDSLAFKTADACVPLKDFYHYLKTELSKLTVPYSDVEDADAVEFLPLPELLCRRFHHVFIVDMNFGRMPQNVSPDPLMDDRSRLELNAILKKPLLRVYFDDPFEPLPIPPRQALEPFWFASAIGAARASIYFSASRRDENNQEQALSEFFLWLSEHVKVVNTLSDPEPDIVSPEHRSLLEGFYARSKGGQDRDHVQARALRARRQAFTDNLASDFAFSFEAKDVQKLVFEDKPTWTISPTTAESFARCRFKGLFHRVMDMRSLSDDKEDLHITAIGLIAHRVLEIYFKKYHRARDSRPYLEKILNSVVSAYLKRNYVKNPLVMNCHVEWLLDSLNNLIEQILSRNAAGASNPLAFELAFGDNKGQLPPVFISAHGRSYGLAGRIDRVDVSDDGFLITDYKMSRLSSLKSWSGPKQFLVSNFQVPIYSRLVAHHFAPEGRERVSFAFASIRDGAILPCLNVNNHADLYRRIFDDESEDGLSSSIDRIFAPMAKGDILATEHEECHSCKLSFVCRRLERDSNA